MAQPQTYEAMIESTRSLICEIAEVWSVTCIDVGVEVRLPDYVTVRIEPIPDDG